MNGPPPATPQRVGFLGPHGTFAEEALLSQPDLAAGEAVPFRDVPHVITAVEQGDVDVGIVPIENSIEGSVTVTLDTLAFDTELLMQREVDLPVSLHLCAPKGTKLADITTVVSHPNPLGQTRVWLSKHLPDAVPVAANSTAEAAQQVAKSRKKGMAAIGTLQGAKHAGLDGARRRDRGPPREPDPVRGRRPRHPRADGPRQDVGRVLPAPGPPGLAARDPPGVRGARDQPHASSSRGRRSGASATTASSSTSRATSTTSSSPTACATCAEQAQVKFLGSYPVAGDDGARAAARGHQGVARRVGVGRRPARAGARPRGPA